jgi:uncharacterized protein (TIRG00374 family)
MGDDAAAADRPRRRGLRMPGALMRAAISAVLLAVLLSWLSSERILDEIWRIPWATWLAVVTLFLIGHAVSSMKWRMLLGSAGAPIGRLVALRAHAAGLFANLCLPSIVGGDVIRAGLAVRSAGRLEAVALGSLADRLIDTTALVGIAGLAAILHPDLARGRAATAIVSVGVLLAVGVITGIVLTRVLPAERLPGRLKKIATRLREALDALFAAPAKAAAALGISALVQCAFVGLNIMLAHAIGIELPAAAWMLAWPLAKLVALIPVSLGGIGVREVALAAFLSPFGVEATFAVAQSLAWEVVLVTAGLLSGTLALAFGGSFSLRAPRPKENT